MRGHPRFLCVAFAFSLVSSSASAHLVSTGLGPLYDGIGHFAAAPEQFLSMAALSTLAGLRGPVQARRVFFILPLTWLGASLLAGDRLEWLSPIGTALVLILTGALLGMNAKISPMAASAVTVAVGSTLGVFYGLPSNPGTSAVPALGAAVCAGVLCALCASLSLPLRSMSATIAVRVAGSWTSALGLLLAGWWIHGQS